MTPTQKDSPNLWNSFRFSFPIQLLLLHFKKNHALLLIWVFLIGVVTNVFMTKYGAHSLFLSPEYLEKTNFLSFAIIGFATGGFIMAFNTYSYVTHGFRFPFIATVSRPFIKFCLNNFIIPLLFIVIYTISLIKYQYTFELKSYKEISIYLFGFYSGISLFIFLAITYFIPTNKDFFKITGRKRESELNDLNKHVVDSTLNINSRWSESNIDKRAWKVLNYLNSFTSSKIARDIRHYDKPLLNEILTQNHTNASVFEILVISSFVILGSFSEIPLFKIPAGASFLLVFTISVMFISAFFSWFKGWTSTVLILLILGVNIISKKFEILQFKNYAYGLNYECKPADYSKNAIDKMGENEDNYTHDINYGINVLNNWKAKQNKDKPKLVIINTTGGGLRSALWTFSCMQHLDSLAENELMNKSHMICGASGGMIGASYYRELFNIHNSSTPIVNNNSYKENLSKDLLNSITFSIATNDIFIRYKKFKDGKYTYTKDRAYSFEKALNDNLKNVLNKRLKDYKKPEFEAKIPLMFFTPTIVNDGRQLLISPHPSSYFSFNATNKKIYGDKPVPGIVEYSKLFENNNSENIKFSSVLRMNATFPYILPIVTLPSYPQMEVMDAGLRDNIGISTTMKYLYSFKDWINENTGGVVIVRINDTELHAEMKNKEINSFIKRFTLPFDALYGNFINIQNYDSYENLYIAESWIKKPLEIIELNLEKNPKSKDIALNWHLSNYEKKILYESIHSKENQEVFLRLKRILDE